MSYKKRKPVDESVMRKTRYAGHHDICQTLREIFMLADTPISTMSNDVNEEIKIKARLAVAMAKAMHETIKKFKEKENEEEKQQTNGFFRENLKQQLDKINKDLEDDKPQQSDYPSIPEKE